MPRKRKGNGNTFAEDKKPASGKAKSKMFTEDKKPAGRVPKRAPRAKTGSYLLFHFIKNYMVGANLCPLFAPLLSAVR